MTRKSHLAPILVWLFLSLPGYSETVHGKVTGITDGDTIKVLVDKKEIKIRLYGIDCPEDGQAFGKQAKKITSEMCFGKTVKIEIKDTDFFKRKVGVVILLDGRNVNQEILKAGYGWWYQKYAPKRLDLKTLEQEARKAGLGLWSDTNPIAPWLYRKAVRSVQHPTTESQATSGHEVYVTRTGGKYHRASCLFLKKGRTKKFLKDAQRQYKPCKVCKP